MRIVAGAHRGRTLVAPKGHSTRPTADRTRQALFNVLEHAPWGGPIEGLRVIDLFAGSGALGLEALSRGAAFCLLADSDPTAVAAITENVRALRLEDRCAVRCLDATRLRVNSPSPLRGGGSPPGPARGRPEDRLRGGGAQSRGDLAWEAPSPASPVLPPKAEETSPFDLAFLDPPYARGLAEPTLASLADGGWLAPGAVVVAERGAAEGDLKAPGYEMLDSRPWGGARVWFLRV